MAVACHMISLSLMSQRARPLPRSCASFGRPCARARVAGEGPRQQFTPLAACQRRLPPPTRPTATLSRCRASATRAGASARSRAALAPVRGMCAAAAQHSRPALRSKLGRAPPALLGRPYLCSRLLIGRVWGSRQGQPSQASPPIPHRTPRPQASALAPAAPAAPPRARPRLAAPSARPPCARARRPASARATPPLALATAAPRRSERVQPPRPRREPQSAPCVHGAGLALRATCWLPVVQGMMTSTFADTLHLVAGSGS